MKRCLNCEAEINERDINCANCEADIQDQKITDSFKNRKLIVCIFSTFLSIIIAFFVVFNYIATSSTTENRTQKNSDYSNNNENIYGNSISNYPNPQIAEQGHYIYFIYNNLIGKVNINDSANKTPEYLFAEFTNQFEKINCINVYKDFIYFSAKKYNEEYYSIYKIPSNYSKKSQLSLIVQDTSTNNFFIDSGILYYAWGENISASTKNIYLYKIAINNSNEPERIINLGDENSKKKTCLIGVYKGYAYWSINAHTFKKYDIKNKTEQTVFTTQAMEYSYQICNGNIYTLLYKPQQVLDNVFGNSICEYYTIDFEKGEVITHATKLASYIQCFTEDGKILISKSDTGTYRSTLEQLENDTAYLITNDYISHPHIFENTIYYFYGNAIYCTDLYGNNFSKIADII